MRYLLLILVASLTWAADPAPATPPEVAKIVAEHDAVVAKAKAVYDAACAKADAEAAKKLEPVVVKLTKAGDLKGATAAQEVLEGWKPSKDDEKTKDPSKHAIVGVWLVSGPNQFTFYPDGKWTSPWTSLSGYWEVVDAETVKAISDGGNNQTLTLSVLPNSIWSWNNGGNSGVAVKTKDKLPNRKR